MQGQSIFQLLTPLIYLMFAMGFVGVWTASRKLRSALIFAFAYVINAFAFLFDLARDYVPDLTASYVTNIFFLTAISLSVVGCWMRSRKPVPLKTLGTLVFIHLAGLSYFILVDPDTFRRTVWVNIMLGMVFAVSLPAVFALKRGALDRVIAFAFLICTLQFFVRPALVFWLAGTQMDLATYLNSPFHIALHFTAAISALMIATSLLASFALKIMSDLQRVSQTDPLTGCLNRRGIEERTRYAQDFCSRGSKPMSVIIGDIDHFKKVNDQYGHATGDEVIRRFGQMFNDAAGLANTAARMGGEEFVLVMSDCDLAAANEVAEKLRRQCGREEFVMGGTTQSCTVSFGVAALDPHGNLHDAIDRADKALYTSKANGRDCVTDEVQASVKELRALDGFTKRNASSLLSQSGS